MNLNIKATSSVSLLLNESKENFLAKKSGLIPKQTMYYLDTLKKLTDSNIPIYFYELPNSYNLGNTSRKYPGTRHTYRFFSINKDDWEANYFDKADNSILISEKTNHIADIIQTNKEVGQNDDGFSYVCEYFTLIVNFSKPNFLEKVKWVLASEYGIGVPNDQYIELK